MNSGADFSADLREHLGLCQELLGLSEQENHALTGVGQPSQFEFYQRRKALLPKLDESLRRLRQLRGRWQNMDTAERQQYSEVPALLRQNQDLVMRVIVLDRENEQALLRRGLVPPRHLPSASQQRPHFVADLYRRNRVG